MNVWYISHDGAARKHVFQTNKVEPYYLWGGAVRSSPAEVFVVHRWRKTGRWGAYLIHKINRGSTLPKPLFEDKNRQTVMAWAQMRAALGLSEGEKA